MTNTRLPERPNISETVATAVRDMIVDGRLAAGRRINEVHLAAALGISRTPLREALMCLTTEGALAVKPRSGFHVAPLTVDELDQIYPMRAILDPAALRLGGLPKPAQLRRLRTLNRKLRAAKDPIQALSLDDAWHLELLAECPNRILIGLIQHFIRRTRRYELALMSHRTSVAGSADDHDSILEAADAGDLEGACVALRHNMQSGKEAIVAWLRERETK